MIKKQNLSLLNYAKKNIDEALKNIKKANAIDPISLDNKLLLAILNQRKYIKINDSNNRTNNESSIKKLLITQ